MFVSFFYIFLCTFLSFFTFFYIWWRGGEREGGGGYTVRKGEADGGGKVRVMVMVKGKEKKETEKRGDGGRWKRGDRREKRETEGKVGATDERGEKRGN